MGLGDAALTKFKCVQARQFKGDPSEPINTFLFRIVVPNDMADIRNEFSSADAWRLFQTQFEFYKVYGLKIEFSVVAQSNIPLVFVTTKAGSPVQTIKSVAEDRWAVYQDVPLLSAGRVLKTKRYIDCAVWNDVSRDTYRTSGNYGGDTDGLLTNWGSPTTSVPVLSYGIVKKDGSLLNDDVIYAIVTMTVTVYVKLETPYRSPVE